MESTGQTTKPDHQAPLPITNSTAVSKQSTQPYPIVTQNKAAKSSQNTAQTPFPFEEKKYIIQFPPDSNEFSIEGYALLDLIIETALKHTQFEIHVNCYTDSSGDLAYNRQLSKFRANVVKSYLVGNGITIENLVVAGLGPANPIASNETPEGRQLNRRVEILLRRIGSED
jgi:general secretion pathway protein A